MSFEVLITVVPPEGDEWPPPRDQFTTWAAALGELVTSIGDSRALDVYGPGYLDGDGNPAPQVHVNIWTDGGRPTSWIAALGYVDLRFAALTSAGYDVSGIEIIPTKHLVVMA